MDALKKQWVLPLWARVLMGSASLLGVLLAVGSAPQAVQDTLQNVPFLSQPTPWVVVVALAVALGYVAIRSGYSPSNEVVVRELGRHARNEGEVLAPSDVVPYKRFRELLEEIERLKADHTTEIGDLRQQHREAVGGLIRVSQAWQMDAESACDHLESLVAQIREEGLDDDLLTGALKEIGKYIAKGATYGQSTVEDIVGDDRGE